MAPGDIQPTGQPGLGGSHAGATAWSQPPAAGYHDTADHDTADHDTADHGVGIVNTSRVSVARHVSTGPPSLPFTPQQLARLDEALTLASRETGVAFSVYLGELGPDTRERAEQMLAGLGTAAPESVLIAVSPGQRVVELVTGSHVARRITDRAARLAVTAMVASFREGDLAGGLVSALRMLADQAGAPPRR